MTGDSISYNPDAAFTQEGNYVAPTSTMLPSQYLTLDLYQNDKILYAGVDKNSNGELLQVPADSLLNIRIIVGKTGSITVKSSVEAWDYVDDSIEF